MFKRRGEPKEYSGFFKRHKLLIAITTQVGTIVGAGMFGIPYVIAKTGFLYGALLMILIGLAFIFLNLFVGEIVLRTKQQHQLTGYVGKYLGRWGKRLMTLSLVFSIYGALTAYLIGEGTALHSIFDVGNPLMYTFLFFVITFFIVRRGVKATGKAELFLISLLILVVILISFWSFDQINLSNLSTFDLTKIFFPYGVIVFAFMGSVAVPEMQEELGNNKRLLKKAILIGSTIPIILYLIFTVIIVGIIGLEQFEALEPNQRIATVALSVYTTPFLGIAANLLAVLAMFTSFLTLSLALREVYEYDYRFSSNFSLFLTFSLPLLITIFGLTSFITILGLSGAFAGGLEGILIVLTYWKAKIYGDRKPEYALPPHKMVGSILIILFLLGTLYYLLKLLV